MQVPTDRQRVALVVDDDHALLDVLSRFLSRGGFTVHTACTAIGAGTIAEEESIDVVVLDLLMPALDGSTVGQILRRRNESVPIVFYTSMSVHEARTLTGPINNTTIVSKNDGPQALLAELQRVVARA